MTIRSNSRRPFALLAMIVVSLPIMGFAPAQWLSSPQLRPSLLETDLPRIEAYLALDDAQTAAVHALLRDQLEQDQIALEAVHADLVQAHADSRDELDMLRSRWANAWDPASAPATSAEGQAFMRSIVGEYLQRLDGVETTPSDAAETMEAWRMQRAASQMAILQDIEVLLDGPQRERWATAMAAAALARSPWPAVLPEERLDLDALLVQTLEHEAQSPRWLDLRSGWLSQVGEAMIERDAVLARNESKLLDARHRKQPGLELHLQRQNVKARAELVQVLVDVRQSMANAMGSSKRTNAFQRAAQIAMHPEIWRSDDADRLARAALEMDAIDAETRVQIEVAWARHRSRRAAVQAHLVQQAGESIIRRRFRPQEHRLLARLFGHGAALVGFEPDADWPLSETHRLNGRLRGARRIALDELELIIPEDQLAAAQAGARRRKATRQSRLTARPPGTAQLSLPITESMTIETP